MTLFDFALIFVAASIIGGIVQIIVTHLNR